MTAIMMAARQASLTMTERLMITNFDLKKRTRQRDRRVDTFRD